MFPRSLAKISGICHAIISKCFKFERRRSLSFCEGINNSPLAYENVEKWAAKRYWDLQDAILLIMGIEPNPSKRYAKYIVQDNVVGVEILDQYELLVFEISEALGNCKIGGRLSCFNNNQVQIDPGSTVRYLISQRIEVNPRVSNAINNSSIHKLKFPRSRSGGMRIDYSSPPPRIPIPPDCSGNVNISQECFMLIMDELRSLRKMVEELKSDRNQNDIHSGLQQISRSDYQYCFIKSSKGWELEFEDVTLRGVKDWEGMKYIKLLLQNPGEKIGVLKLQSLLGTDGTMSSMYDDALEYSKEYCDSSSSVNCSEYQYVSSGNTSKGGIAAWEDSDQQAIREYKEQITTIEDQLTSARSSKIQNRSKIERLEKEKAEIEKHLSNSSFLGKDPSIEKARKHVLKVVSDAKKNIRKLEELTNYNNRPISSHLSRYIKTGASCSYSINEEDTPPWKF